jgi:hypothetical protein
MRPVVAPVLGVLLTLTLRAAWGAVACPPTSIAGSPNSLTTSRPEDFEAEAAKCSKPAATAAKAAPAQTQATVRAATPLVAAPPSWKSALDPLSAGGWAFLSDGPAENPSALYASTHNMLHDGNVVTAWMRWEFSQPQAEVYPLHYLSAVTREELDCDGRAYRRSAIVYYLGNNLQQKGPAFTALNDDTTWKPAIPGSEGDAMLNWGCPKTAIKSKPETDDSSDKSDKAEKPAKTGAAAKATATPAAAQSSSPVALSGPTDVHTAR